VILIGQYDSPFVRRVGIALTLQGLAYRHEPWSAFGDAERISACNPLTRVPTLVLDDGDVILDSHAIIDHLETIAPPGIRMLPRDEPARRRAMRTMSLALGMADLAVSLFYELRLHQAVSPLLVERRTGQIKAAAALLESERATITTPFARGDQIGHDDIALAVAAAFVAEAHPGLLELPRLPTLTAFCARAEALPVFQIIRQPFRPPA
jgi:glutathione S-transferase